MGLPSEEGRFKPRELFPELFGPPPEIPPEAIPPMRSSLLPVSQFRIPPEAPQELPERGILGDIGAATVGSLRDVAEMGLRAARTVSPFESAYEGEGLLSKGLEALKDTDKWDIMKPSKEVATGPWYRRWVYEGIRSSLPSLSTMITGAIVGQAMIPVPGVGAVIGAGVGQAASALPFGASEYDRFMEEAKEKGIDQAEAKPYALASGATEWMGETLGNWLGAKILRMAPGGQQLTEPLKNTIRQMFKVPLKEGAKDMVKEYINETGTEFFTIGNTGDADLTWSLAETSTWLSVLPASGTVEPGDTPTDVTVTFDSTGVAAGTYHATLTITSNDEDEPIVTVEATLIVENHTFFLPFLHK